MCRGLCKIAGMVGNGRSVLWCGFRLTAGKLPHAEHDWYSPREGEWLHCHGTSVSETVPA